MRPTPALVVATIALFVALGGTAGAVVTQAVPLAKRALVADNAKRLGGQTAAQVTARAATAAAARPGPASTAAGLVTLKTSAITIGAGAVTQGTIACDPGQKVLGGGFGTDGPVISFGSGASNDATWAMILANLDDTAGYNITLSATCLR